jgi:peptidoglycan/xylan/chitin deacetylase (PgdA/CDA1 family)
MIRLALQTLSLGKPAHRRLSVLIFHRVLPQPDELHPDIPDVGRFDRIVAWLCRWFNVIALDEAVQLWKSGQLPARAAAITFDDGYADNLLHAAPVLRRHGVSATFFIATAYLNGGRMWNDTVAETLRRCKQPELDLEDLGLGRHVLADWSARRASLPVLLGRLKYLAPVQREALAETIARRAQVRDLPGDLMLSTTQLRTLHNAGMLIGAHTVTHPILAAIDDDGARTEIVDSRQRLEALLQAPVSLFAYPNGKPETDYRQVHADMVREAGFSAAVTTAAGAAGAQSDAFQLPRFTPWDQTALRFGMRMVRNLAVRERRAAPAAR